MLIRYERPDDWPSVYSVNEAAFGRPDEAELVERLRAEDAVLLSLVAQLEGEIAGHILFSRMWIDAAKRSMAAAALGPLAVLPQYQRRGIGQALVLLGLDLLANEGEQIVIVLGEPQYYSRFGFSAEKTRSLKSPFPPEFFMAMELSRGALGGIRGKVRYSVSFGL